MNHLDEGTLHAWLDGELDGPEERRAGNHLQGCEGCRGRLEEAREQAVRAASILAEVEPGPVHAPDWRDVESRARLEAAGEAGPRSGSGMPAWQRTVLPWAASLILAFGLGWLASDGGRGPLEVPEEMADASTEAPGEAFPGVPGEVPAGAEQGEAEAAASPGASEPAPEEVRKAVVSQEGERQEAPARDEEAGSRTAGAGAGTRSGSGRVAGDPDRARLTRPVPAPAAEPDHLSIQPSEARAWLGTPPARLPDLELLRAEVGSGARAGEPFSPGPVIRLLYADAAGQRVSLLQQRVGDSPPPTADLTGERTLTVLPSGTRSLRWRQGGLLLVLSANLDAEALESLADRVR